MVKVDGHLLSGWYNRHSYLQLNKNKLNNILRVLGVSKLSPETFMTIDPDRHGKMLVTFVDAWINMHEISSKFYGQGNLPSKVTDRH